MRANRAEFVAALLLAAALVTLLTRPRAVGEPIAVSAKADFDTGTFAREFIAAMFDEITKLTNEDMGPRHAHDPGESWVDAKIVRGSDVDRVRIKLAMTKCKEYHDAAKFYRMVNNRYPATLKDMEAPLREGDDPYQTIEPDPWGNEYVLEIDGRDVRVSSFGPDGVEGTDDDIRYPD